MRHILWGKTKAKRQVIRTEYGNQKNFATLDPGVTGGAVIWLGGEPTEMFPFKYSLGYAALIDGLRRTGVRVVAVETPFVGRSNSSALTLAQWRGYALGRLDILTRMTCIDVAPSVWQASVREFAPKGAVWDKRAKWAATLVAARRYPLFTEAEQGRFLRRKELEGITSAMGMGHWWLNDVATGFPQQGELRVH